MEEIQIITRTTGEIPNEIFENYVSAFNYTFEKSFPTSYFRDKYGCDSSFQSFHSFAIKDKEVIAAFTVIPQEYFNKDGSILLGLSCDSFVLDGFRSDELLLYKLFKATLEPLKKNEIKGIIGIPNPKALKYWKVIGKWEVLSELNINIVPLKLLGFRFLTPSLLLSLSHLYSSSYMQYANGNVYYLNPECKYYSNKFRKYNHTFSGMPYQLYIEEGYKVSYLFSTCRVTKKNLLKELAYIARINPSLDLIIFISNSKSHLTLFKFLGRLSKRKIFFTYYPIDPEYIFDNNSIAVDLENFDNR